MKYRKRPFEVEAEIYHAGLEDGFSCIPFVMTCEWKDETGKYRQCDRCILNIPKMPFLTSQDGHEYIHNGDYIVTEDGIRYRRSPCDFEAEYEGVK